MVMKKLCLVLINELDCDTKVKGCFGRSLLQKKIMSV